MKISQVIQNITQIGVRLHSDLQSNNANDHPQYFITRDVIANIPASTNNGALFFATDESKLYRDNGTTWDQLGAFNLADLDDVGISLTGNALKALRINSAETLFELYNPVSSSLKTYISSDTWTKPTGLVGIFVEVWGAGGGGGTDVGWGGGGGGGYNFMYIPTATLGATETITIATAPAKTSAGGNSSFGSLLIGYGGGKGGDVSKGGGGGGEHSVGGNATSLVVGTGGSIGGGDGFTDAKNINGGGGGGGSSPAGNANNGGGGGTNTGSGGLSINGGNGGASGIAGTAPAGGGGGGAAGSRGEIRVIEMF